MATANIVWRRLPIGLIRDEDMDLISSQLPPELKPAPYMFYLTALCKADDDGVFDIEDGLVFARLMKIGTSEDVFTIANLMMSRHMIARAGNSTRCIFTDWEYPMREKSLTMEERREKVTKKIEQERKLPANIDFSVHASTDDNAPIQLNLFGPGDKKISFENDKKPNNVVMNIFNDKIEKNVVENIQTEREKERERELEREERKETHTETEDKRQEKHALQQVDSLRACDKENTAEINKTVNTKPEEKTQLVSDAGPGNIDNGMSDPEVEENRKEVTGVMLDFFTKYNLGFDAEANFSDIALLAQRITGLGSSRNPAQIVAQVFLKQFKILTETDPYYKGAPLTPQQLLTPGTYSHVLGQTSKVLLNKQQNEAWQEQQKQLAKEIEAEKARVGNAWDNEYVKYNIDPKDPGAAAKLLIAKNFGSPEETEPP